MKSVDVKIFGREFALKDGVRSQNLSVFTVEIQNVISKKKVRNFYCFVLSARYHRWKIK